MYNTTKSIKYLIKKKKKKKKKKKSKGGGNTFIMVSELKIKVNKNMRPV